jgi:hypothetical protein
VPWALNGRFKRRELLVILFAVKVKRSQLMIGPMFFVTVAKGFPFHQGRGADNFSI